jgi:hypothetical protein
MSEEIATGQQGLNKVKDGKLTLLTTELVSGNLVVVFLDNTAGLSAFPCSGRLNDIAYAFG